MRSSLRKFVVDPRCWAVVVWALQPVLAQAYFGQTMVQGLYTMVGLPIIFIAFLWSLASLLFSQQHLSKALYTLLAGMVFTALLYSGDKVMGWIQASQGGN